MEDFKYILASASPRRKALLEKVIKDFEIVQSQATEVISTGVSPVDAAMDNALRKALNVSARFPEAVVIGADTIVVLDDVVIGKPAGPEDAVRMLEALSGRTHCIVTGVSMTHGKSGSQITDFELTDVTFKRLSDEVIREYVAKGTCLDKAGAYGIQDVGKAFVENLEGDYDNVVGLPTGLIAEMLDRIAELITIR